MVPERTIAVGFFVFLIFITTRGLARFGFVALAFFCLIFTDLAIFCFDCLIAIVVYMVSTRWLR